MLVINSWKIEFRPSPLAIVFNGSFCVLFIAVLLHEVPAGLLLTLGLAFACACLAFELRRTFGWRRRGIRALGCESGRWYLVDGTGHRHIETIRVRAHFPFAWELRLRLADETVGVWIWRDMLSQRQWWAMRSLLSLANYG